MSDYTNTPIGSGYNTNTAINTELTEIETAINSKMDKSGTTMTGDLDINSNDILNVNAVDVQSLNINGVNVAPSDVSVSTLPSQTGHENKLLTTNGTVASWSSDIFVADSISTASSLDLTNLDRIETSAYYGGWAATIIGPKGGTRYHSDGTTGTANTVYADRTGFFDVNGKGFKITLEGSRINVNQLGAKGDGTTDDTIPFTSGIALVPEGGTVYAPANNYKITSSLPIHSGLELLGDSNVDQFYGTKNGSENPTFIFQATAATPVLTLGQGVNEWLIKRLAISSVISPVAFSLPDAGKHGIQMTGSAPFSSYRGRFEQVSFYNFARGIDVQGTGDWQIDDIILDQCQWWNNTTGVEFNTTNADAWTFINPTSTVAQGGSFLHCVRSGYMQIIGGYSAPAPLFAGGFVTGTDAFRLGDFPDNMLFQQHQVEFMRYFLHVDTSTGFENNFRTYTLDNCIVESPCLVERQCTIVSNQSRYTRPVVCSGDKIEVHSNQDTWETPASSGTHNGAGNAAILSDSTANRGRGWATDRLVGETVTNNTDGSSGTITANTQFTVTATLTGGTDDDWDSGDRYNIPVVDHFDMTGTNPNLHYSAGSVQTSGVTTMATATATTLFALLDQEAVYNVVAYIANTGDTNVVAEMTVITDGSATAMIKNADNTGTAITLSVSGLNVQCTQITGALQSMSWKYYRLA